MAQQFHNGLTLDYEGMMRGELGELWGGRLNVKASEDALAAVFEDDSWYVMVAGADPIYIISEDAAKLEISLARLREISQKQADKVLGLMEDWAREAAAKLSNSMSRR
jgi:hypothetical protein